MNINSNSLYFILTVLLQVNAVPAVMIYNPYAKLCFPNVAKNMDIKVFDLISRTNETRYVSWHETYACKCRLDASDYNIKQHWNNDKCRGECKELIDKGMCDDGFIWNHSVNLNVINHVILQNIQIMQIANVEAD